MKKQNDNFFRQGYFPNEPQPYQQRSAQQPQPQRIQRQPVQRPARPAQRPRNPFPVKYLIVGALALCLIVAGVLLVPRLTASSGGAASWATADLVGEWVAVADGGNAFAAAIADDTIVINWDMDSADMKALYWKGTFRVPAGAEKTKTVVSEAAPENATALLASSDAQKTFTVTKTAIQFEASAMGVTRTFTLKRR